METTMATLASMLTRFFAGRLEDEAAETARRQEQNLYRLRAVPNEDVYFFVKRIDNSSVVRQADPTSSGVCWKVSASACIAVLMMIGVLLPSAYGLLAGYHVQALRQEQQRLVTERSALELEEAKLMSPKRLEELARMQSFVDPAPQKVVYLESKGRSLAMLKRR